MSREERAADIFMRAAAYIRRYGWRKEGMGEHGQARCSMGALASAHQAVEWDRELARLMYETLYDELGGISLTTFNSRFASGEKVALLYERVARRLRAYEANTIQDIVLDGTI